MSLVLADARALPIVDACVQCVVTSPPYWGLRDYGLADGLGLEATPDAYVAALVAVFREVRRVLRPDGIVWLNLGDSYHNLRPTNHGGEPTNTVHRGGSRDGTEMFSRNNRNKRLNGLKEKDLVGIPWRVAFALQADGWWLRSDIIWSKPNPMPESVTDRPTKAHEYVFLLSKRERYYYDADAVREPHVTGHRPDKWQARTYEGKGSAYGDGHHKNGNVAAYTMDPLGRNVRSVWTINPQPYSGAHFATFPEQLVERCILAGSKTGDLILDPFVGSGTVGRVAISLGRKAVGCDLQPRYLSLAKERLQVTRGLPFEFEEARL